jgi:hypothetical protein
VAAKTLTEARDALETALDGVTGLVQTHSEAPDSITAPAAVVQPAPGDFLDVDPAMDDIANYQLYVTLYVQRQKPEEGQRQLDALLAPSGAGSVFAAINAITSMSCRARRARNYGVRLVGDVPYIACDVPVDVMG